MNIAVPTIDDVARLANVSTATVSRCLNSPERVKPQTREQVQKAVDALGYTPNFGGRVLASNRTWTVGAVIPTMDNAIFAEAMQSMEEALSQQGMTLFISTSQYRPEREDTQIRSLLSRGVDALVLIGSETRGRIDDVIARKNLPCINLWTARPFEGRMTIGFNNEQASKKVAKYVFDHGHRNIAMLSGVTHGNGRAAGRLRGVRAELKALGSPLKDEWVDECRYDFDEAKKAALALLQQPNRPTAIICGNDVIAIGVIMAANQLSISLPSDLSIIGFDDLDIAHAVSPALTTVRVPHRRMGKASAEAICSWIENGEQPHDIVYETEIIERATVSRI